MRTNLRAMKHWVNSILINLLYRIRNIYPTSATRTLNRHGLKPLKIINVDPSNLNTIRPVSSNEFKTDKVFPLPWFDDYFKDDWRISRSMLVKVLEQFYHADRELLKDEELLKSTDYYKMHDYLRSLGAAERPDGWIFEKIRGLVKLAENIEKEYQYNLANYIIVLDKPMCQTRYNIPHEINGYEIYTGHHRAACASFFNFKNFYVLLAKDEAKTSPYGEQLNQN